MSRYFYWLLIACIPCLVWAEQDQILISGTITSVQGNPISGARVNLVGFDTIVYTNSQGEYSIEVDEVGVTSINSPSSSIITTSLGNHLMQFSVAENNSKVGIKVMNATGSQMFSVLDRNLASGSYNVNLIQKDLVSGLYFVQLQIGQNTSTYKMVVTKSQSKVSGNLTKISSELTNQFLAREMLLIDTLEVVADGFVDGKKLVPSYIDVYDFVLNHTERTVLKIEQDNHLFVTGNTEKGSAESDFDFCTSIPASKVITNGKPAVLSIETSTTLEISWYNDYLNRYQPNKVFTMNAPVSVVPYSQTVTSIDGNTPETRAIALASSIWERSKYAVVVTDADYENALQGSALASLFNAPLLYSTTTNMDNLTNLFIELETDSVLILGNQDFSSGKNDVHLSGSDEIALWVKSKGIEFDYIAATNSADISEDDGPKLSLSAPLLAARRGGLVYLIEDASTVDIVLDDLKNHYTAIGGYPKYLAIVGTSTTIPVSLFDDHYNEGATLKTDALYSNVDDDLFPEIAVGRIVANNGSEASLIVSRTSTWDLLKDGTWDKQMVQTGLWNFAELAPLAKNYGLEENEDLIGILAGDNERVEAALILHNSHSSMTTLGNAFTLSSESLLAPSIVISGGCAVAGMSTSNHKYISKHLFKLGLVGFVGATVTATAGGTHWEASMLNHLLMGESIGEAYKNGMISKTIKVLNSNSNKNELREYHNMALYGDPALVMTFTVPGPTTQPATSVLNNNQYKITIPETYYSTPLVQDLMDEWSWTGSQLYVSTIPGIISESGWTGAYNEQEHFFTAGVSSDHEIYNITQNTSLSSPLGMEGSYYIDEHQDGTNTAWFIVRVQEFNSETNSVIQQAKEIEFTVSYE